MIALCGVFVLRVLRQLSLFSVKGWESTNATPLQYFDIQSMIVFWCLYFDIGMIGDVVVVTHTHTYTMRTGS